jgi:hypothetical protein
VAGGRGGFEIDLRDPDRVAMLTEALEAQPDGDSGTRAALLGRLSLALAFTEAAPEQRETLSTEAVAMARRLGDPAVLAVALAARCDAISGPDHVAERRAAAAEIIELTRAAGDRAGEMLGRRLLVVALAEAAEWSAVDAEISSYARLAEHLAQHRLTWYVPLWRGARALMHGDLARADEHARELGEMAERAGSVNASADAGTAEAEALSREREALLAELSATTGLGGRLRVAGSPTERMRKAVTYRIRHAIARIADAHPELGRHLRASVRTGTWCSYAPEHRVDWQR